MGRYTSGGIGRDVIAGALAGAAAVWVMDKLDWSLYRSGGKQGIAATEAARPEGMDPAHTLAAKAADKLGVDIGDRQDNPVGHSVHYGIGMGMGALYGALRGVTPAVSTARGGLFGLAMFILQDEIGNTVLGLAGNPMDYPVRDHARGAAAHTLFGVVTDLGTRLLAPWRDEVVIEQGPPISERIEQGRQAFERGRDYLYDQGRQYLDQGQDYVERGRGYARDWAEQARARMPDMDDAADLAERGRKRAGRFADDVRSRLPDIDTDEIADRGRKHAKRLAREARSRVPDVDTDELVERGRKQATALAEAVADSRFGRALRWLFG